MASPDPALQRATDLVARALAEPALRPQVRSWFDPDTCTVSHLVRDPQSSACALIDSVLDYDAAAARTSTRSAAALVAAVQADALSVQWQLETHVHADHLSAAPWLRAQLGGTLAIGAGIVDVQQQFGRLFNADAVFARDGSQFDRLFADGDTFRIGDLEGVVLHVPGHTPACLAYVIGDSVFPGDTLFMPDYGSARCDFPGGSAARLYQSARRLLALPPATRMFLCHDYKAPGRDHYAWETTVAAQRAHNIHLHEGMEETAFVALRTARDATLSLPRLLLPAVQVNMQAGQLPAPEANGVRYLKIPLDQF